MDITEFWKLIETARAQTADTEDDNGKAVAADLTARLAGMSELHVFEYEQHFEHLHDALYRWDVWAAAHLINRGCSDDAFMDFRAALIAQGRTWYERVLLSPDELADHPQVRAVAAGTRRSALFQELVNYIAARAYEELCGEQSDAFYEAYDAFAGTRPPAPTEDEEEFEFHDRALLRERLPRLSALFAG